jgi:hypothetical protein
VDAACRIFLVEEFLLDDAASSEDHSSCSWNGLGLAYQLTTDQRRTVKATFPSGKPPTQHSGPVGDEFPHFIGRRCDFSRLVYVNP